ncbi:MAG: DUF4339 domain-containing protein [Verrucomicrobiales bacterium]|nr:DUF4339 domain-containing protein [Verrucomicrobiales bacterium]
MYWMIGGDGREYGPVAGDQLREWIKEHRANGDTRVRPGNTGEWQPLAALPEFATDLGAAYGPAGAVPPPLTPPPSGAGLRTSGGAGEGFDIGGCVGRAWALLMRHFGIIAGACAVVWGILLVAQMLTCVGSVIRLVLTGPLYAGLSLVVLRLVRGQGTRIGDAFSYFGPAFVQFMLLGVVVEVATAVGGLFCVIPGLVLQVLWIFAYVAAADRPQGFWEAMEASRRAVQPRFLAILALMALAWLPVLVFSVYTMFHGVSYAFDLFSGGSGFNYDRAKLEEFARYYAPLTLQQTVVVLLNMPFAIAVTVQAYEDIFGPRPGQTPG